MLYGKSAAEAARDSHVVRVNERDYVLNGYIGASPVLGHYVEGNEVNDNGEPQGFLVHQPPGAVTLPHFHETDQFQVVVDGAGRIGKSESRPVTVQYVNAHTPYGPVVAGDDGMIYFTLRACWDPGAKYMPACRDKLIRGNQRMRLVGGIVAGSDRQGGANSDITVETLIGEEADRLAAYLLRAQAGAAHSAPDPKGSGGQYIVVVEGSMLRAGEALGRLSCLFLTEDEPALDFRAGDDGLALLVLQLPRRTRPRRAMVAAYTKEH